MNLKKTLALGLALSGLLVAQAGDTPDNKTFAKRLRVTPNGAAVASGENHADVPVLLRLSTAVTGFDYSDFKQGGQDMLILDETANVLPFEIESWNPEGESLVWVKVKNFTANTKFTVYYGADAANAANDPKDVWSAYAGVWHFDETEGTTVADATGRGGDGTSKGDSKALASGVIAGGRHNRNKNDGESSGASGIVFDGMKSVRHNGKITLSAWTKRYHVNSCWDHLFYNKASSSDSGGFASELNGSGYGQIAVIGSGSNSSGVYINHGISAADTWYHVAMVYDVQNAYFYNNGEKKGGGAMKSSMGDNGKAFSLGNDIDTNGTVWEGAFDEFRVSLGAMSDERVALEYKAMLADALSVTVQDNSHSLPVPGEFAIAPVGENALAVTFALASGTASSATLILSDGTEQTLTETAVSAGWRTVATVTGLASETDYSVSVRLTNGDGDDVTYTFPEAYYNGAVSVTATADAREENLTPGTFVFTRAETDAAMRFPLTVRYTVGGSATPDADYVALSGTVTIPAGEASATVEVVPLRNPLVDSRINVTVTVADGPYSPSGSSATLAIRNFRSPSIVRFAKRMEIAVVADKYTGSELADFPVPVRLREGENGFRYSDFQLEGGADMAFFDADGNVYPHEIDTWNPQGESLVWVKVPSFSASTRFFIGFSAASANESTAQEVWSAYTGVWHMGEAAEAATTLYDATAHQLNGTYGTQSSTMEGKLGNGRMMTTTSSKPSSAGQTLVPYQSSMDVDAQYVYASMWVKYTSGTWAYLITRKSVDGTKTWGFQMNTGSKAMRFYGDAGTSQELSWGGSDFPTEWTKLDMVMSGGTYGFYVNGEKKAGKTGQNWPNNNGSTAGIAIGGPVGMDTWSAFNGAMDEVRLTSSFTPSDDWIKAQYLLESDATALTYGTVSTAPTVDLAVVDSARVVLKDGVPTVTASLLSGTATVSLLLRDEAGVETRFPLGNGPVTAPHEFELPLSSLPGSGWYDLATIAEDASGDCDEKTWSVRVKKGAVAVEKAYDADATALRAGAFVVSRPADDTRLNEALEVPYVLTGSLVNGTDYAKLSGVVTIPAGKTSVQVPVVPLIEGKTGDVTLTLAAADMTAPSGKNRATVKVRADGKVESRIVLKVKGYSGAAVENVPVLVRLTEGFAGFSYGKLRNPSTGSDLHFQDELGNELPFEIDEWHSDGESVIWVRMSRLARGARLVVCYGGDAIASEAIPTNRSETWAEQTAVYHMIMNAGSNDRYGNSAGTDIDKSRGWNESSVVQDPGVSGFGQLISSGDYNAKDSHGVVFNNDGEDFKSTDGTFTASCWIKYKKGQDPAYDRILCHKKKHTDTTGWEFMLYDKDPTKLRFRVSGETAADMEVFATPVNDGEWHYLTFVFSGSTVKVYENGVLRTTGSTGTTTYTTAPSDVRFAVGNSSETKEVSFKGTVDEVRWAPVALSADRIKADYETVANLDFFTIGDKLSGLLLVVR